MSVCAVNSRCPSVGSGVTGRWPAHLWAEKMSQLFHKVSPSRPGTDGRPRVAVQGDSRPPGSAPGMTGRRRPTPAGYDASRPGRVKRYESPCAGCAMRGMAALRASIVEWVLLVTVELASTIHERLRGVLLDARQGVTRRGRHVRGLSRRPSIRDVRCRKRFSPSWSRQTRRPTNVCADMLVDSIE